MKLLTEHTKKINFNDISHTAKAYKNTNFKRRKVFKIIKQLKNLKTIKLFEYQIGTHEIQSA